MAVGNFTTVDGQNRHQIAKFNVGNVPTAVDPNAHQTLNGWTTNLFTSTCSPKFETYMSDVEFSPDGNFFVVGTTGAYGGTTSSVNGTVRLRRGGPVREQRLDRSDAGHLDGVHRRRHHVDRRGHRQRRLRRRTPALAEQPRPQLRRQARRRRRQP